MPAATAFLDTVLDRSLVLGYTKIGPALRRRWWPRDPAPGCLVDKHVVVTGATSGIGEAMVGSFARLGATVHVLGRDPAKVERTVAAARAAQADAVLVPEVCDLADLDAVRAWCADLAGRLPAVHGLVHNAGVMTAERQESPQGHELGLAVHVLAPHLATELLLPQLTAGAARVVLMSSGGMYSAGLRSEPDEIEYRDGDYDGVRAYARTKRMQVVLADAWDARLRGGLEPAVRVESCHPGWAATPGVTDGLPGFDKVMGPLLRDAESGADTPVWLVATRPPPAASTTSGTTGRRGPPRSPGSATTTRTPSARFLDYVTGATGTTAWPA